MSKKFQKGLALEYPVYKIKSNSKQPREYFDDTGMEELRTSIKAVGRIINPIKVKWINRDEGTVIIVDGERRWRAAKDLKMSTVPVVFENIDSKDIFKISFVSNYCKQDMTELECAKALEKLIKDGMSRKDAGALIGMSEVWVSQKLSLLNLTPQIQDLLALRKISANTALAIASYSPASQKELLSRLKKDERAKGPGKKLTVHETRLLVQGHAEKIGAAPREGKGNKPMGYCRGVIFKVSHSMDRLIEDLSMFFDLTADQMREIGPAPLEELDRGRKELEGKLKRIGERVSKYLDD